MSRGTQIRDRHAANCAVCNHAERELIEERFCDWSPQTQIAREFKIPRTAIWRHARAFNLFERRDTNVKGALHLFLERGANIRPTPASYVRALELLARIDADGRVSDRVEVEHRDSHGTGALFAKMTVSELEQYAATAQLPSWWPESETPSRQGGPVKWTEIQGLPEN